MEKLTNKQVKQFAAYGHVLYTRQPVNGLQYLRKLGYNAGVNGWNFDVYEYELDILLIGNHVPGYANYIEPSEVENFIIKRLEEKINNMDIVKERLIYELAALKENKNNF